MENFFEIALDEKELIKRKSKTYKNMGKKRSIQKARFR